MRGKWERIQTFSKVVELFFSEIQNSITECRFIAEGEGWLYPLDPPLRTNNENIHIMSELHVEPGLIYNKKPQ